jgi:FMN-dependent NADH-azoreductase
MRLILKIIGITDATFVTAGGAKVVDLGEVTREAFLARFDEDLKQAAI